MAQPIEIPLVGDASSVIREAQRAGESFEDFGDSLNDVARDAERMGDAVGDDTEKGQREASRALDRLESDFNTLAREAQRDSKKVGDSLGDDVRRGARRGSEAVREFRGEAIQNLSEVASSFDGSIAGVADGIQGLAGGASAGLIALGGPAAAAGAALAGIGLIGGAVFQGIQQDAEASAERVRSMYEDMAESGNDYLSEQFINAAIQEEIADNYARIQEVAKLTGLTEAEVARAMVTDGEERNRVLRVSGDLMREQLDLYAQNADGISGSGGEYAKLAGQLGGVVEEFKRLNGEQQTAADQASLFGQAVRLGADDATAAVGRTADALDRAAGNYVATVTADTSAAETAISTFTRQKRTVWLDMRLRDQYGRPQ